MNIENMNKAIAVMERAKLHDSVDMQDWQADTDGYNTSIKAITEAELHACGNKACFGGHLAISPEWLSDARNSFDGIGGPTRLAKTGIVLADARSVADWLGIDINVANLFIYYYNDSPGRSFDNGEDHILYGVPWKEVKAEHVIRELTLLRDLGEVEYINSKRTKL